MLGGPTTSGFVAKRASASASSTTKGAGASGMIAWAQKASSLRVGARLVRSVRTAQKAGHGNREQPTTDSTLPLILLLPARLGDVETDARLEPLALDVNERDEADGHVEHVSAVGGLRLPEGRR